MLIYIGIISPVPDSDYIRKRIPCRSVPVPCPDSYLDGQLQRGIRVEEKQIAMEGELSLAVAAGKSGDPAAMVRHLFNSRVLDKLAFKVHRDFFGRLSRSDIDDCLAEAVADAFSALQRGEKIQAIVSYLLKATKNMAIDLAQNAPISIEAEHENELSPISESRTQLERKARDLLKQKALAHARSLLPQIGQENIQRVMEVILDAVEHDIVDLTDLRIAELTGLQEETVRRLKNRALQRLGRLAKDAGFNLEQYQAVDEDDRPFVGLDESE